MPAAISRGRASTARDDPVDDRLERRILAGTSRSSPGSADESGSRPGTAPGFGTVPGITRSRSTTSPSFGSDACSPAVYGCSGCRNAGRTSAYSTTCPPYITATRCAVSATTPRSCVMRMTAMPISRCSSLSSSRICAWIVTSSAVVGSSAISMAGLHASAIAIITRCRMPPDSWCGYSSTRCAAAGMPTRSSISMARVRACGARQLLVEDQRLDDLLAARVDRIQRGHRLLEDHRDLLAADRAHLLRSSAERDRAP